MVFIKYEKMLLPVTKIIWMNRINRNAYNFKESLGLKKKYYEMLHIEVYGEMICLTDVNIEKTPLGKILTFDLDDEDTIDDIKEALKNA